MHIESMLVNPKESKMKSLILLSLIASQICFASPVTMKGMPAKRIVTSNMAEVLSCRFLDSTLLLQLNQSRKSNELGVMDIWSRHAERAQFADIFSGNFEYTDRPLYRIA